MRIVLITLVAIAALAALASADKVVQQSKPVQPVHRHHHQQQQKKAIPAQALHKHKKVFRRRQPLALPRSHQVRHPVNRIVPKKVTFSNNVINKKVTTARKARVINNKLPVGNKANRNTRRKSPKVQQRRPLQKIHNFARFLRNFGRQLGRSAYVPSRVSHENRRKFIKPANFHPIVLKKAEDIAGFSKFTLDDVINSADSDVDEVKDRSDDVKEEDLVYADINPRKKDDKSAEKKVEESVAKTVDVR